MHLFGYAYKGPTYDQSNTFTHLIPPIHPQAALTLISHGLKHYSPVDFITINLHDVYPSNVEDLN